MDDESIYKNMIDPDKLDLKDLMKDAMRYVKKPIPVQARKMKNEFHVKTMEGWVVGKPGDYLIIGIRGEPYPCDAAIFEESYDEVA